MYMIVYVESSISLPQYYLIIR